MRMLPLIAVRNYPSGPLYVNVYVILGEHQDISVIRRDNIRPT